ncbi:hypothetical protein M0R45_030537 [Rubus argutus]|uniref:Protein MIZU-KUSSEI 1-like n=1 Tax=Rubus argutus TaxID=59490 RepID=A0AAW1WB10_RUBAR
MNLQRSNSVSTSSTATRILVPSNQLVRSSSSALAPSHHRRYQNDDISNNLLIPKHNSSSSPVSFDHLSKTPKKITSLLRSFLNLISFPAAIINLPASCKWLAISSHISVTPSLGRKVTGTLFGNRRGNVSFAVQLDPKSEPVLLLELAMSTSSLVKEDVFRTRPHCARVRKASGFQPCGGRKLLFHEPTWTMYCNGRKLGLAVSRTCGESDWHVLSTVRSVSVEPGRDSEAFYMLNPDGSNGGPELSIFLLRI